MNLKFNIKKVIPYTFRFYYNNPLVYALYFWGFSPAEVIKYTMKYAEFKPYSKQRIISKLIESISEVINIRDDVAESVGEINSICNKNVDSISDIQHYIYKMTESEFEILMSKRYLIEKDITLTIDEVIEKVVDSLDYETREEIEYKTLKFVEKLVESHNVKDIFRNVERITGEFVIENISTTELNNIPTISKYKYKSKGSLKGKCINSIKYKDISITSESCKDSHRERTGSELRLRDIVSIINKQVDHDMKEYIQIFDSKIADGGVNLLTTEYKPKNISLGAVTEVIRDKVNKFIDSGKIEVGGGKTKGVVGKESESLLINQKDVYSVCKDIDKNSVINNEYKFNESGKVQEKYIHPLIPIDIKSPQNANVVKQVRTENIIGVNQVSEGKIEDVVSVSVVKDVHTGEYKDIRFGKRWDVHTGEYKDIRFGKRWRFKTGEAFDKIWLIPTNFDMIDEHLTVEAKITFKAMLDFILFVEQLMKVNRFFYAASRAVTAIDDIVRILEEWIIENRPEPELPDEYWYLVRWYKWFAAGEHSKNENNMELNGLIVLEAIKEKMVEYFESRWGKRVVEYGPDDMYIYSKDYSYITRIRTKKHGRNIKDVNRNDMRQEYGIDERDVPYDIETDSKGKRKP